jgi:hypothetical protein
MSRTFHEQGDRAGGDQRLAGLSTDLADSRVRKSRSMLFRVIAAIPKLRIECFSTRASAQGFLTSIRVRIALRPYC